MWSPPPLLHTTLLICSFTKCSHHDSKKHGVRSYNLTSSSSWFVRNWNFRWSHIKSQDMHKPLIVMTCSRIPNLVHDNFLLWNYVQREFLFWLGRVLQEKFSSHCCFLAFSLSLKTVLTINFFIRFLEMPLHKLMSIIRDIWALPLRMPLWMYIRNCILLNIIPFWSTSSEDSITFFPDGTQ